MNAETLAQIDGPSVQAALILPWNLKKEIVAQLSYTREWGARCVVPIPEVEVL